MQAGAWNINGGRNRGEKVIAVAGVAVARVTVVLQKMPPDERFLTHQNARFGPARQDESHVGHSIGPAPHLTGSGSRRTSLESPVSEHQYQNI